MHLSRDSSTPDAHVMHAAIDDCTLKSVKTLRRKRCRVRNVRTVTYGDANNANVQRGPVIILTDRDVEFTFTFGHCEDNTQPVKSRFYPSIPRKPLAPFRCLSITHKRRVQPPIEVFFVLASYSALARQPRTLYGTVLLAASATCSSREFRVIFPPGFSSARTFPLLSVRATGIVCKCPPPSHVL